MQKSIEKQYFAEATSWDDNRIASCQKSEQRAWKVAIAASSLALMLGLAVITLTPLKTVESFIIRVDNNTGAIDFISRITNNEGIIDTDTQKSLDQYWLSQYIKAREGYQWETRQHNRDLVGLMSDLTIQQHYAEYTDPKTNINAPVTLYGDTAQVLTQIKSISFISKTETKKEALKTALVRYTKTIKKRGEHNRTHHLAATITFKYVNTEIHIDERLQNPMGFQVTDFKINQESHLGEHL